MRQNRCTPLVGKVQRRLAAVIAVTLLASCGPDALPEGSRQPAADTTTETGISSPGDDRVEDFTISSSPLTELPTVSSPSATFPLAPSEDGNVLIDQQSRPFLVVGDAAWSMLVQLDLDQTNTYLAERKRQGFNTLLVNLIEHHFSDDPPRNAFGDEPLLGDSDFSQPNPAYFDSAHDALERAASMGFLVLLAPAYLGYEGGDEGWYESMVSAGPDALYEYGRFVGERFGDLDNIIWVHGGDFTPPDEDLDLVEAVRDGLIEGGAPQLHTAHWSPETSATDVDVDWLDLNTTYTYGPVYVRSSADDNVAGLPHVVIESQYEDDQFENTGQRLRSQAYEAVLTGAIGSVFGNGPIWQFQNGWEDALQSEGARHYSIAAELLRSLPWADLVPDAQGALVKNPGDFGDEDFVVAAATADLGQVVAYIPSDLDPVLDLGRRSGPAVLQWFDPASGTYNAASEVDVESGRMDVRHPGPNADGDLDWILLVRLTGA